jgi:hypothetical protein
MLVRLAAEEKPPPRYLAGKLEAWLGRSNSGVIYRY